MEPTNTNQPPDPRLDRRLRALLDVDPANARNSAGDHDYDAVVADLSPDGVAQALRRFRAVPRDPYADPHDEAACQIFEASTALQFEELELHRRHPMLHAANLDITGYQRDYAPLAQRMEARKQHLAQWPEAVAASIRSLQDVPAPIARASLAPIQGLVADLDPHAGPAEAAALAAHGTLMEHLRHLSEHGSPRLALGEQPLSRFIGVPEGIEVDLTTLAALADAETARLQQLLARQCSLLDPGADQAELITRLLADHPDIDGVLSQARALTAEVLEFTRHSGLVPYHDGNCVVGPAPEAYRWAMAMMSWAMPFEQDLDSEYWITPPEPDWPRQDQEEWLATFSATTLSAITVHEVAPGHFSHGRAMRQLTSPVRKALSSESFIEGWAHYAEEMALEQGFRGGDARFGVGVAIEALVRVTRLRCAIGLHTAEFDVEQAAALFTEQAFLQGPAAMAEAVRGTFDPSYGRYTWGKLLITDLRDRAVSPAGGSLGLPEFHAKLLALGAPPLGLIHNAL